MTTLHWHKNFIIFTESINLIKKSYADSEHFFGSGLICSQKQLLFFIKTGVNFFSSVLEIKKTYV